MGELNIYVGRLAGLASHGVIILASAVRLSFETIERPSYYHHDKPFVCVPCCMLK